VTADKPPRVALATCDAARHLTNDDRPLIAALADQGIDAEAAVWNDPGVDWSKYDLVVVRSTWDYVAQRDEFLAWAESIPRIWNKPNVLRWCTDKSYLQKLADHGVPVIPTIWLNPERHLHKRAIHTRLPAFGDFVVKPVISSGARDTGRYRTLSAMDRGAAITHAMGLLESGRAAMIQPYVTSVDTAGETCLTFIDGKFQHATSQAAVLKGPLAPTVGLGLYSEPTTSPAQASAEQIAVAEQALQVLYDELDCREQLLYARIDVVDGADGPLVIEMELADPNLWMQYSGANPTLMRFAEAIAKRVQLYRS
jgi:glutathione synthase/RimK-type ligase-like ATP-grasp enzyme